MSVKIYKGNIFNSNAQTIVNATNCVGVMGAGIALEYRLRYPEMFRQYTLYSQKRMVDIGILWIYEASDRRILNFPTKFHWKEPSKPEYLHAGLKKFMETHREKNIKSVAFPLLGAQHGKISANESQEIMESYLKNCLIPVEIYHYDPKASDKMFERFRAIALSLPMEELKKETGLPEHQIQKIVSVLNHTKICQLNQVNSAIKEIGVNPLEKTFALVHRKDITIKMQRSSSIY